MNATAISYRQTATKEISLRIETTFGNEVIVINRQQALQLITGLEETISTMPKCSNNLQRCTDELKLSPLVWLL